MLSVLAAEEVVAYPLRLMVREQPAGLVDFLEVPGVLAPGPTESRMSVVEVEEAAHLRLALPAAREEPPFVQRPAPAREAV